MPARRIEEVVTIDAMQRVANQINGGMAQLLGELPKTSDSAETAHRRAAIQETVRMMSRAALVCLKEFRPEHYQSVMRASVHYARDRLRDRPARFILRPKPKWELPNDWLFAPIILGTYQVLLPSLKSMWTVAPKREVSRFFVSHTGRYGEPQQQGTARRFDTQRLRIQAIQKTARQLAEAEPPGGGPAPDFAITEQKARRWLRELRTPTVITRAIIAEYLNAVARNAPAVRKRMGVDPAFPLWHLKPNFTERRIRTLLIRARANDRELHKLRKILDGEQSTPPF